MYHFFFQMPRCWDRHGFQRLDRFLPFRPDEDVVGSCLSCCLKVSKCRHLCVVVGAPAQLPWLVEDLESLCWRTSDLVQGWGAGGLESRGSFWTWNKPFWIYIFAVLWQSWQSSRDTYQISLYISASKQIHHRHWPHGCRYGQAFGNICA